MKKTIVRLLSAVAVLGLALSVVTLPAQTIKLETNGTASTQGTNEVTPRYWLGDEYTTK